MDQEIKKNKNSLSKLIGLVAAIGIIILLGKRFNAQDRLLDLLDWIKDQGAWGPAVFIIAYIVSCILFIPGSFLSLGAGAIFGVVWGSVYVSAGSMLGATCAFLIGRYFAREAVARKIEGNTKFEAIDKAVANEGWKIVGLIRLSPMFPFNLLNYAFGLTRVSLRDYFFASWIAMLPGTIMYVYIGSLLTDIAVIGHGERTRTGGEWVLYIVGLIATIIATVYVTKVAQKALATRVA